MSFACSNASVSDTLPLQKREVLVPTPTPLVSRRGRPALVGTNVVADSDNLVDKPSMQALAMGSKLAFLVCQSSPCGEIALAILPVLLHPLREQKKWLSIEPGGFHGALVAVTTARHVSAA